MSHFSLITGNKATLSNFSSMSITIISVTIVLQTKRKKFDKQQKSYLTMQFSFNFNICLMNHIRIHTCSNDSCVNIHFEISHKKRYLPVK